MIPFGEHETFASILASMNNVRVALGSLFHSVLPAYAKRMIYLDNDAIALW